jgi:very-short-patch-repair endonuclease
VFRIAGAPQTANQRIMAATLWAGGRASCETAAHLLRLDAIAANSLHVITTRRVATSDVRVHVAKLGRIECVTVDDIPCTSATRTLVDCAADADAERLEAAFEAARRMGLTSVDAIANALGRGRGGSARLRRMLAQADIRPMESPLEVKLAQLLRKSGLPMPVAQFSVGRFRVDFAWPDVLLVCECDGFQWHCDRMQWKRDRRRIAAIEAAGYRVVHVTWDDVTKFPAQTVDRIAQALKKAA